MIEMNQAAGNVFIKYNPYTVETIIRFDALDEHGGVAPKESNPLHSSYLNSQYDKDGNRTRDGRRLQEWIEDLPSILKQLGFESSYTITFCGTTLDYEDVKAVADESPIITSCEHIQGRNPEDKVSALKELKEAVIETGKKARTMGFESIADNIDSFIPGIEKEFESPFEAYVVAPMSAGKSTLINALLGKRIMTSAEKACTDSVTRIFDTGDSSKPFSAQAFAQSDIEPRFTVSVLTYEEMKRLNYDTEITNIVVEGYIPFLHDNTGNGKALDIPFAIVDTPGTNNIRNKTHRARTMKEIESGKQSFIVFILNASNGGTNDEGALLEDISKAMKKDGKLSRDRFLFVVNKLDNFYDEDDPENVKEVLFKNRDDLAETYNITDARIYPISAGVALTSKRGIANANAIDRAKAETMIMQRELHLDEAVEGINAHIPASARAMLKSKLSTAVKNSDIDTQAEIHSGVPSLEAAIREHLEKYALAMRIEEIAKKLRSSFKNMDSATTINNQIMTDSKKREEILAAADIIRKQINSGERGKAYEKELSVRIQGSLDEVERQIEKHERTVVTSISAYCNKHNEERLTIKEAVRIKKDWDDKFEHTRDELMIFLTDCLNNGIKQNAEKFLEDYRRSVETIMPRNEIGALPFDPLVLLGAEMTLDTAIDSFRVTEKKSRQVAAGTKKVKNPAREGFFGFFNIFQPWNIEVDVYKTEYYTKEFVDWNAYAQAVMAKARDGIAMYCGQARKQAKSNSDKMLADFISKFKQLNAKLLQKIAELETMSKDREKLEERIAQNNLLIKDIDLLQNELNSILEI